jgi:hypothetical protein
MAAASGGNIALVNSGVTTSSMTAGQIGIFPVANTGIYGTSTSASTTSDVSVVGGSWHTIDQITEFIGGLKMTTKSQPIPLKSVTRFWKKAAVTPVKQVVAVGWNLVGGSEVGPTFECGKTYRLRLDLKGSPVMRFLGRNAYYDLDAYTGCCPTDCNSGCTSPLVDPVTVLLQFKDEITKHPWLSKLVTAKVYWNDSGTATEVFSAYDESLDSSDTAYVDTGDGTVVAGLEITAADSNTSFSNNTFTTTDHYELEPLSILASLRMDDGEDSNPCQVTTTINTSTGNLFTVKTAARQGSGIGETVLRDWILSQRYQNENFPDGQDIDLFRMRETEDDVTLPNVSRTSYYDEIHILYNTDHRNANPTSVQDRDQYELVIYVPTGTNTSTFTNLFAACLTAAGSNVTLESYT